MAGFAFGQEDSPTKQQGGRVVLLKFERRVAHALRRSRVVRLQMIKGEPGVEPGRRFRIDGAGRARGKFHQRDGAGKAAFEPTDVRAAGVGLEIRAKINHGLIGLRCFRELALFHQYVAEQTVLEGETASGNQFARQRFGLLEPVLIVQRMTAQQHRFETARLTRFQTERAIFGELEVEGIETHARLRDKRPAKLFDRPTRIRRLLDLPLQPADLLIGPAFAPVRRQDERTRVEGMRTGNDHGRSGCQRIGFRFGISARSATAPGHGPDQGGE